MKKLLALLLALVMVLSLAACGGEDNDSSERRKPNRSEQTEEPNENADNTITEELVSYEIFEEMDDTVVVDNEYATITLGAPTISYSYVDFNVYITNKCNETLSVESFNIAVNGYTSFGSLFADVEPGENITEEVFTELHHSDTVNRITMELKTHVNYENETTVLVDVYPNGKAAYEEPALPQQEAIYSDHGVSVYALSSETDYNGDYKQPLLVQNASDEILTVRIDSGAANGLGISLMEECAILPGMLAELSPTVKITELKELGMEDLTQIDMNFTLMKDFDLFTMSEEEATLDQAVLTLYPQGQDKAETFQYVIESDDVLLADEDDLKIHYVKAVPDETSGMVMLFLIIENTTGSKLYLSSGDTLIDGKEPEMGVLFSDYAYPGTSYNVIHVYPDGYLTATAAAISEVKVQLDIYTEDFDTIFDDMLTFEVK